MKTNTKIVTDDKKTRITVTDEDGKSKTFTRVKKSLIAGENISVSHSDKATTKQKGNK